MDKWKVFVTALRLFKYDYMAMWGFVQRPRGRTISEDSHILCSSQQGEKEQGSIKVPSLLLTDGAACHTKLAKESKFQHRFCVH